MPKNTGASLNRLPTPLSQPNASQITNAVESGMIVAASTDAPNSPIPNSDCAKGPATGSSACAASVAEVIVVAAPLTATAAAVATTMNTAITFVQTDPTIASACSSFGSSSPMPFSATALCR